MCNCDQVSMGKMKDTSQFKPREMANKSEAASGKSCARALIRCPVLSYFVCNEWVCSYWWTTCSFWVTGKEVRNAITLFLTHLINLARWLTNDIDTLSTRTTFSDRVSLNAFQNGGKPSLWYNFCLDIMIWLLLFAIWQPVIIVPVWLTNAGICLSFINTSIYLKYLTLNENDELRKVISWFT